MYIKYLLISLFILVGTGCASKSNTNSALEYSSEKTYVEAVSKKNIGNGTYVFMWIAEAYRKDESASANHRLIQNL